MWHFTCIFNCFLKFWWTATMKCKWTKGGMWSCSRRNKASEKDQALIVLVVLWGRRYKSCWREQSTMCMPCMLILPLYNNNLTSIYPLSSSLFQISLKINWELISHQEHTVQIVTWTQLKFNWLCINSTDSYINSLADTLMGHYNCLLLPCNTSGAHLILQRLTAFAKKQVSSWKLLGSFTTAMKGSLYFKSKHI